MGITSLEMLHRVETENTDGKKSEIRLSKKDNALASICLDVFRTTRVSRLREPLRQLTLKNPLINK